MPTYRHSLRFALLALLIAFAALCGCGDGNDNSGSNALPNSPFALNPSTATAGPGQSTTYNLTLQPATIPTEAVTLNVVGLPEGATYVFDPPQIVFSSGNPIGTTTLVVTPQAGTPAGTYDFAVQGTLAGTTFTTSSASLVIRDTTAPSGNFTLTVNPSSVTVQQNAPATVNITVTPTGGFTGPVTLSVSGGSDLLVNSPTPSTLNLNNSTPGTATLQVSLAPGSTNASASALTITASGSSGTRTATVNVQIQP